jgi:hypothetical protein
VGLKGSLILVPTGINEITIISFHLIQATFFIRMGVVQFIVDQEMFKVIVNVQVFEGISDLGIIKKIM